MPLAFTVLTISPLCRNSWPSRKLQWPVKNSVMASPQRHCYVESGSNTIKCSICCEPATNKGLFLWQPKCKCGRSKMKVGMATPAITPITNLQNFSSHLHNFGVHWLWRPVCLFPRQPYVHSGEATIMPLNLNLRWLPGHSETLLPWIQQAKERVTPPSLMISHDYQR